MPDIPTILTSLLAQQTPVTFQACGPSMNPTIHDGECVRIVPASARVLRAGDLMLYAIHGRMAVHRLIHRHPRSDRWLVAADAALHGGDWVAATDLLGVAESVIRGGHEVRLNTRRARWTGLLRFYLRPLRRLAVTCHHALFRSG